MASGRYAPGPCELLAIRDPKPRLISRTPIRDRVVHTALVMLIEPVFEPSYSPGDFACRPGYGAHRAVLELQRLFFLNPEGVTHLSPGSAALRRATLGSLPRHPGVDTPGYTLAPLRG